MSKQPEYGYFVTGTDTDVGKTFVACQMIEQMRKQGKRVGAYKPVASGAETIDASDAYSLWRALGGDIPFEWITPQRFAAPLAPPLAAQMENRSVSEEMLLKGIEPWSSQCEYLIVEGAGGLLSPLSWSLTNADLAQQIGYPLVLVASNRLGVVHQILATAEVALQRGLPIAEIVLNDTHATDSDLAANTNLQLLKPFLDRICPNTPVRRLAFAGKSKN
jgi:dethiobiotin synthetase